MWKRLKDSYRNAMNRGKTASGEAAKKLKKWRFEEQMPFLQYESGGHTSVSNVEEPCSCVVRNNTDDATEHEDSNKDTADESESAVAEGGYSADSVHPIPTLKRKVSKQRDVDKILSFVKERNRSRKELLTHNHTHTHNHLFTRTQHSNSYAYSDTQ